MSKLLLLALASVVPVMIASSSAAWASGQERHKVSAPKYHAYCRYNVRCLERHHPRASGDIQALRLMVRML